MLCQQAVWRPTVGQKHRDPRYGAHGDSFAGFCDYPRKTKRVIPVVVLDWNFCEKFTWFAWCFLAPLPAILRFLAITRELLVRLKTRCHRTFLAKALAGAIVFARRLVQPAPHR